MKNHCKLCGKEISEGYYIWNKGARTYKFQNYCGKCNHLSNTKTKKIDYKEFIPRYCIVCGQQFDNKIVYKVDGRKTYSVNSNRKYCSEDCHIKNNRKVSDSTPLLKLRFKILDRDGFRCQYCGLTPKDNINLQIIQISLETDHIYPKSNGGKYEEDNLITACEYCNSGKSDILLITHLIKKGRTTICDEM